MAFVVLICAHVVVMGKHHRREKLSNKQDRNGVSRKEKQKKTRRNKSSERSSALHPYLEEQILKRIERMGSSGFYPRESIYDTVRHIMHDMIPYVAKEFLQYPAPFHGLCVNPEWEDETLEEHCVALCREFPQSRPVLVDRMKTRYTLAALRTDLDESIDPIYQEFLNQLSKELYDSITLDGTMRKDVAADPTESSEEDDACSSSSDSESD